MPPRDDWNLRMVRCREARALLPTLPAAPGLTDWGAVKAGHLDTGYTRHPVFGDWGTGGVWLLTGQDLNTRPGENAADARDPLDYEGNPGHGTRTGSILCGDARGLAGAPTEIGVAPRLPTVSCRVINRVVLTPERNREAVAAGIRHCVGEGCAVLSISAGMPFWLPGTTGGMGRAVDDAYEAGVIVVAAAGQIVDSVVYPGKYDRTIGVGGVTWQRRIWFDYEAGKTKVDVWAPAADVWRADSLAEPGQDYVPPIEADDPGAFAMGSGAHDGSSGKGSGTSYATPHVAAAAAMWLRLRGAEIDARYPEPWQRVEAFRRLLKDTASNINGAAPANGSGILDILALVQAPLPARSRLRKAPEDKDKWA